MRAGRSERRGSRRRLYSRLSGGRAGGRGRRNRDRGGKSYFFGPDVKVSGGSTLNGCPFGASPGFASAYNNTEVEPQVAVNPLNPAEYRRACPDRWPDGGAAATTSWMSSNSATSWSAGRRPVERLPGWARRFGRVTDPWVSYDGAGNLYFIGQPIDSAALGISAISVTSWNRRAGSRLRS